MFSFTKSKPSTGPGSPDDLQSQLVNAIERCANVGVITLTLPVSVGMFSRSARKVRPVCTLALGSSTRAARSSHGRCSQDPYPGDQPEPIGTNRGSRNQIRYSRLPNASMQSREYSLCQERLAAPTQVAPRCSGPFYVTNDATIAGRH
jgi:hypothetical protein